MRMFVALDIDDGIRGSLARFIDGVHGFAPEARWVRPESLHVTLKFIGEKPEAAVEPIRAALSRVQAPPPEMIFRGYGFFPGTKAARVFWIGIDSGPRLAGLARQIDEALVSLEIPKPDQAFTPHLTLARGGEGSGAPRRQNGDRPNRRFSRLQQRLTEAPVPEFGTMTAREFCLYQSQLAPGGSRYVKIAQFGLQHPIMPWPPS
jgi:RNA 2',3'-cyclic 3'-phosphodiesterase